MDDGGRALQEDASRGGLVHAGEAFHERGFAAPVLPKQAVHLPGKYPHIDAVQRLYAGEVLADGLQLPEGLHLTCHRMPSPPRLLHAFRFFL